MLVSKTKYEELAEKLAEKEGFLKELTERFEVQKETILKLRQELAEAREQAGEDGAAPLSSSAELSSVSAELSSVSAELTALQNERLQWEGQTRTLQEACEALRSRLKEQETRYEATLLRFADVKRTMEQRHREETARLRQAAQALHKMMCAPNITEDQRQYLKARIEELLSFLAEQEDHR